MKISRVEAHGERERKRERSLVYLRCLRPFYLLPFFSSILLSSRYSYYRPKARGLDPPSWLYDPRQIRIYFNPKGLVCLRGFPPFYSRVYTHRVRSLSRLSLPPLSLSLSLSLSVDAFFSYSHETILLSPTTWKRDFPNQFITGRNFPRPFSKFLSLAVSFGDRRFRPKVERNVQAYLSRLRKWDFADSIRSCFNETTIFASSKNILSFESNFIS